MKDRAWHWPLTKCFLLLELYLSCPIPFTLAIQMAPPNNAPHISPPRPLNGARDVSSPFGSAGRPWWQERRDLTERPAEGRTDEVDSGQTAVVRPLPGESRPPPPLPFAVTEMELINPVYSGNILQQRRRRDGRPQVSEE